MAEVDQTRKNDDNTITVRVPISIRRRGGRKLILTPDGTRVAAAPSGSHVDNAMVKAIARAFRWRDMLETGQYGTIREIAVAEQMNEAYLGRILRLTLLAPVIIDNILDGTQRSKLELKKVLKPISTEWFRQIVEIESAAEA
jgi:hypothetical protein